MVKVYFESNGYAELVAVFKNDAIYASCVDGLEKLAGKYRMILTESVDGEIELSDLIK